ncbi:uncharacterized protein [Malus domestica]|uniref:uncharacterized protein n=1 Tax=Malus domestica TaxID=3750 RepID=UPI003975527C
MLHFVDEGSNLQPSPVYEPPPPSVVSDNEPIVPEIPVTSEVIVSRVPACPTVDIDEPPSSPQDQTQGTGAGSSAASSSLAGGGKSSPQRGFSTLPGETPGLSQQILKETFHLVWSVSQIALVLIYLLEVLRFPLLELRRSGRQGLPSQWALLH